MNHKEKMELTVLAVIIIMGVGLIGLFTFILIRQFKDFKELDK